MSKPMKFLRLLNGETTYKNFEFLYAMLKVTARDRSVQRESVWRNQPGNKQGEYLSNVAIGYGKTAILHLIDLEANVDFLKRKCNSAKDQRYIDRLEEFLDKGDKWSHVDGGNRADTIIDWYDDKVYLIPAIYPLYEQDEFGRKEIVGTVTLNKPMNREELIESGGDHERLVRQLENQLFTIEIYSELTEEDRRDLFKNLNDNVDLSIEEIRNSEISIICNEIRNLNDKWKKFFVRYGWVTDANADRYKFCAWLGYMNNFFHNAHFKDCKSWSPKTLDEDYKSGSPEEKDFPNFKKYFEKTFVPLVRIINDSESHYVKGHDEQGNEIIKPINDKDKYKNLGTPQRNTLMDLHIILVKIMKDGYSLSTTNRKPRLEDLFLTYKDWLLQKVGEMKEDGVTPRTWTTNGTQEGKWLDLYGANTNPKIQHRLNAIKNEFIPLLIEKELIIKKDDERTFPYDYRQELWTDQKHICALTGKYISLQDALNTDVTRIDHIIPHSKGGKTVKENAQLVFNKANQDKSDK